ncbi:hypothetical protein [Methylobacterium trifolii]|uniref:Uncharacterized protein n=1 Tax=Methylobacterium trifolii TaxID=1003092 RepID=A0ABQ4TV67_9HYPH|nr:hypothetical protein [Methylobacterium trifolii]GJE59125.1 hypothetical protein MPOCJGCO_1212 [Methylobacterium trifolii]
MTTIPQTALDALCTQHTRFANMIRDMDGGIWWASDAPARVDAAAIKAQAACIGQALDEVERLVKRIAD